jgi:2-methylisocitrate lyase-like PEP mutase family enzyme
MEKAINQEQYRKAEAFKKLHERAGLFVMPNPWDAGSARMLAALGFEAMATTSAGLAFSLGKRDGEGAITRDEALENARAVAAATAIPVSADMENCYGDDPETCAETILLTAQTGVAGCSIEDNTGEPHDPIYPFELAVERVKAAVRAARSLPFPFTLTARAENLIYGRMDLADTIRRLEAFADAGADVLFAPGLKTKAEVEAVVKAVAPRPVNVVVGLSQAGFSISDLEVIGVRRISLGSSLARAAYSGFFRAAEELKNRGSFQFAEGIMSYGAINDLLK